MLKLKPRKRIDPNKIPKPPAKPQPAYCAFCKTRIPRPGPLAMAGASGGTCSSCGAFFVDDSNGKLGGEAFVVGLTLLAGGDQQAGMRLREGQDYEQQALAYDGRAHQVQPDRDPRRYGVGRMWYFRPIGEPTP